MTSSMGVEMTVSTSLKAMLSYIDSPEYISSLNLTNRAHILLDTFVHNFRIHLLNPIDIFLTQTQNVTYFSNIILRSRTCAKAAQETFPRV